MTLAGFYRREMDERRRDKYGRAFYSDNEVPPADEQFALWRGKRTHPGAVVTSKRHHEPHDSNACVGGWIPSGEWWHHCGICRPERRTTA